MRSRNSACRRPAPSVAGALGGDGERGRHWGQLAFFAELVDATGRLFDGVTSPTNAPAVVDLAAVESGRATALGAGDGAAMKSPRGLSMNKIIGDESLRRALAHLAAQPDLALWLCSQAGSLMTSAISSFDFMRVPAVGGRLAGIKQAAGQPGRGWE